MAGRLGESTLGVGAAAQCSWTGGSDSEGTKAGMELGGLKAEPGPKANRLSRILPHSRTPRVPPDGWGVGLSRNRSFRLEH